MKRTYWHEQLASVDNDTLIAYVKQEAEDAGAYDMGRPDGMLLEAAYRLEIIDVLR